MDHLEKTFVALKLWKIQFASGLKATDDGGPNGQGTEIVYNATRESGFASGFLIRPDGTIATNFHVARRCRRAEATFADGTTLDIDSLEAYDRQNDLALLKMTSNKTLSMVELDNSDVHVYDRVYSVGNPMGGGMSVTEGMVNRVHKDDDGKPICIQHSAAIAPGNSGGPLYRSGLVVGVYSLSIVPYEIHFAVPVSKLLELMESPQGPSALEDWFPSNPSEIIKKTRLI
ncbi:MAG: serine protease, partial [bacterium]